MPNAYFQFKQFTIHQEQCAMKVSTEACILGAWAQYNAPSRILDIGTGTGLLALMLAQRYDCPIDAVELDESAAKQATENVTSSPWSDQIHVIHDDIQDFPLKTDHIYDLIVCNPPFFTGSLKSAESAKNLAKHETEHFDKSILVEVISKRLSHCGTAFVIYPEAEAFAFQKIALQASLRSQSALVVKNQPGAEAFRVITALTRSDLAIDSTDLIIRSGNQYTQDFTALLAAYYL